MLSYRQPEPSLAELAAALAASICRNHPFVDGNKRVALLAAALLLDLNGTVLDAKESEAEDVVRRLAEGSLPEAAFAEWIARNAVSAV